jgi:hypothetical protein
MSAASNNGDPNDGIPPELLSRIATRLQPVCPQIPEDEFRRLVRDVARVKLKYDGDQFADLVGQGSKPESRTEAL